MSNKILVVPVFPSSKMALENDIDLLTDELIIASKTLEEIMFDKDWTALQQFANRCKHEDRKLVFFVNHEMIKWEKYDITIQGVTEYFNLLEMLDKLNMSEINLVDAGLHYTPEGTYKTVFKKHVANIWIKSTEETMPPWRTSDWIFHEHNDNQCHVLEDLDYITYPCYSFLTTTKTHRMILYAEGNRYGWWQTNPYLTYNHLNQYGLQDSMPSTGFPDYVPLHEHLADTYYRDNNELYTFINNFKDRPQAPAPSELYVDTAKHFPFVGDFHPSARTFQDTLISLSMESETETKNYFITEKTCQPMWNLCPVTVLGQPGTNKYLTSIGLDMFPDIVDWTKFDHIEDTEERSFAFASAVNDLHENFDDILNNLKADKTKYYTRVRNNWKILWKITNLLPMKLLHNPLELINNNNNEQEEFHKSLYVGSET